MAIPINSPIVPLSAQPVTDSGNLKGGLQIAASNTARDNIFSARRSNGMEANVLSPRRKFRLESDLTTWSIVGATVHMSPAGSDTNTGEANSPVLTAERALEIMGPEGTIFLRAGDYYGLKFDCSNINRLSIRTGVDSATILGVPRQRVRVFLGEKKTVFTEVAAPVWKTAITTPIPVNIAGPPANTRYVFEEGTPEGEITTANAHPSQKQRSISGAIVSTATGNPTVFTTSGSHNLQTGYVVYIAGVTGPGTVAADVNGSGRVVTRLSPTTFSVPINTTDIGTGGTYTSVKRWRLEHFRLRWASSLGALAPGQFWYQLDSGVPTLYFRRTDDLNPNTVGTGIWLPSQSSAETFINPGTNEDHVEVEGVEVYFGGYGFRMFAHGSYRLQSCLVYGCSIAGVSSTISNYGEEYDCEYAACGEDGQDGFGYGGISTENQHTNKVFLFNPWAHDNADQGVSPHGGSQFKIYGGLLENNPTGGCLGGGTVYCNGVDARNNLTCGFGIGIGVDAQNSQHTMECVNCSSEGDACGFDAGSGGRIIIRGGRVSNATVAALKTASGSIIEHSGLDLSGNAAISTGAGTVTDLGGPARAPIRTVATLGSAVTAGLGTSFYVSDAVGSPVLAVSDGTVWKRGDDSSVTVT